MQTARTSESYDNLSLLLITSYCIYRYYKHLLSIYILTLFYTRMKSSLLFIVLLCTLSVCTGNQRKSVRKSSWGLLGKYQSLINDIYQIREAITDLIKGGLIKGEAGEAGVNGTQGSKGIKGGMGATGQTGLIGGMGDKGEKGDVGPKGERGEVSPSGAEDNLQAKGDTGLQGLRGDTGKM